MRVLSSAFYLLVAATALAQPRWPQSDLQDWVDYREPEPLSGSADISPYFQDVPYPRGVLFSTATGSLYWYDEAKDTVTCLLPLNGKVDGLSMSADRSLYSFSYNGQPYLWRPATQPGVNLVRLSLGDVGPQNTYTLQLNATGSAAILTCNWNSYEESGRNFTLLDLKTMTKLMYEDGSPLEFTPDGRFVVHWEYDYNETDEQGNYREYSVLKSFLGGMVKRYDYELPHDPGRYDTTPRWERKETPQWYQNKPARQKLDSWEEMGLPPGTVFLPSSPVDFVEDRGGNLRLDANVLYLEKNATEGDSTSWSRKMRHYGGGADARVSGKTLVVLTSRPGAPGDNGFPGPRAVLRQYNWLTGETSAPEINLFDGAVSSILEWDPGHFVAVGLEDGRRLEYSFETKKTIIGNGTTAIRGRSITEFLPSMTGSLSYQKGDKLLTMPKFSGQVGGITSFVVRDDQKLVVTKDEMGQVAVRRVEDGEVLVVTQVQDDGTLDLSAMAEMTEKDFKGVFPPPAASAQYRITSAALTAGPNFRR